MTPKEYEELKSAFLQACARVPLPLRNEIIAVVDKQAVTWMVAKEEIIRDTKNAAKILQQLRTIKVI